MSRWITGWGSGVLIGVTVLLLTILATLTSYHRVQVFVERSIMGVSFFASDLLELYSERVTTSTSFTSLQKILEGEILPRLHIRQFAFLQNGEGSPRLLCSIGIQEADLPLQTVLDLSGKPAGKYRPLENSAANESFVWIRLSIELKIENQLVGLWLFGRRDPDDFYSQREINLLKSLANQTAIAMSNIIQTQRLLEMYQQDISRHEDERMRLAMDLHDSILNQLAAMMLILDDSSITPSFQAAYDELAGRLREIVSDLRPAMLNYGLKPALEELVESLVERDKNGLQVIMELETGENRYPAAVEQHLFRIIQESSENSLRHGKARKIKISGVLQPAEIALTIADDGTGFDVSNGFELAGLIANRHFGLAGMMERARMIGGEIKIDSRPSVGTRIDFQWQLPKI